MSKGAYERRDGRTERELVEDLLRELYPKNRSITGPEYRESLDVLSEHVPFETGHVPSGTDVFDWTIPPEWHVREAYVEGPDGTRYADFDEHNLHVVNYSAPVDRTMSLSELKEHVYTLPNQPDAIPYVTSYYEENWGFCLEHDVYESLPEGEYRAYVDSEFVDGDLTYGHTVLPGESDEEVLLSTYLCHPSMGNNELSGPAVMALLYDRLAAREDRRYTYRFVVVPETIGSITYLHQHGEELRESLVGGLVLTCLGGPEPTLSYKASRRDDALLDRTVRHLRDREVLDVDLRSFTEVLGSDERQYCSPGFDLPVGQMARTVYEEYPEYHTSKDDLSYVGVEPLLESAEEIDALLRAFEYAGTFRNRQPYGEPMLSKRNLYPTVNNFLGDESTANFLEEIVDATVEDERTFYERLLTALHYSDGDHSMVDVAERRDCSLVEMIPIVELLAENDLLVYEEGST